MLPTNLTELDNLVQEFYAPNTNNERKRCIEELLMAFKIEPTVWRATLDVALDKRAYYERQHLWYFAVATIDEVIAMRWPTLTECDQNQIRNKCLHTYAHLHDIVGSEKAIAVSSPAISAAPLRAKLSQLIVQLAVHDANHCGQHVDFCLDLACKDLVLGVALLRCTLEVAETVVGNLNTQEKRCFYTKLRLQRIDIMDFLTKALLTVVFRLSGRPLIDQQQPTTDDLQQLAQLIRDDNRLSLFAVELLECMHQSLIWLSKEKQIEICLQAIQELAVYRANFSHVSLKAVAVLNEFFCNRNMLARLNNLNGIVNIMYTLLNVAVTVEIESYSESFREMFCSYLQACWVHIMNCQAGTNIILILQNNLIAKNGALIFADKLKLWQPIVEGLNVRPHTADAHEKCLARLVTEIVSRMLAFFNQTELEQLDNVNKDEEALTELDVFRNSCIDCLALVAEQRAAMVFREISAHWQSPFMFFINLGPQLHTATPQISWMLSDFSTICLALARVAPLLELKEGETDDADMRHQLTLLANNLMVMLNFFHNQRQSKFDASACTLTQEINYVYAHIITAIRIIFPISKSFDVPDVQTRLIEILSDIIVKAREERQASDDVVCIAATELLLFITSSVRPKGLLQMPQYIELLSAGPYDYLDAQTANNIYISIVSNLVLPWRIEENENQDFPGRSKILYEFVTVYAREFLALEHTLANAQKILHELRKLVSKLTAIIDFHSNSNNNAKQMLAVVLQPIIIKSVELLNFFGRSNVPIISEVAKLMLSVLRGLQAQLGASFIKDMVVIFINVCNHCSEEGTGVSFSHIGTILQIFQLIVIQPGQISTSMLPTIIDFTIGNILPLAQDTMLEFLGDDIPSLTFALFDRILFCQWHYFYERSAAQLNSLQSPNVQPTHFLAILKAYYQVLLTCKDMTLLATVLRSLQSINATWQLFQRPLFQQHLIGDFASVLVAMLISTQFYSLINDLAPLLYELCQVDKGLLLDQLQSLLTRTDSRKMRHLCDFKDIPSFTLELTQIIRNERELVRDVGSYRGITAYE